MICADCGGVALWVGPAFNLTHTECTNCGAVDSQLNDDDGSEEDE